MKVLSIGRCNFDITCEIDNDIVSGSKNFLGIGNRCGGGAASNVAYLLGKWGIDVSVGALVGSDSYAEAIKKEFAEVNVNTNFLETNFEQPTALSFITVNKQTHDRTIYTISNEYKPLKKYNYDFTPDVIFSDAYDYGATQNAVNKYPKALNFLDAREVTNETLELSKYMRNIIASTEFAEKISGMQIDFNNPTTLVNVYSKLISKYPNASIVVTLGNRGALYKADNQIKIMPGLNVEAKDITGSKDAFIAAYIYSIINNFDIEKTISLANIAGGLVSKEIGGRSSMPSLSDVLDEYNKKVGAISYQNNIANNVNQNNVVQSTAASTQAQQDTTVNVESDTTQQ